MNNEVDIVRDFRDVIPSIQEEYHNLKLWVNSVVFPSLLRGQTTKKTNN